MSRAVRFVFPAKREFVGLARLAVGGLASNLTFDAEAVEEIKLAVSEVCTSVVLQVDQAAKKPDLNLHISLSAAGISIDIDAGDSNLFLKSLTAGDWEMDTEAGLGLPILTSLVDTVELVSNGNSHSVLRLKKSTELPI